MISQESSDTESAIKLEISNLMKDLQLVRRKTNEYQLIQDAIFECLKMKGILNPQLHSTILSIIMSHKISKSIDLNSKSSLLSTKSLELPSITYEGQNLKNALEECLKKKRHTIFEELKEIGIKEDEIRCKRNDVDIEYKVLADVKTSLNEKQKLHVTNLTELIDIYNQIIQLKINKMPSVISDQVDILKTNTNKLKLRSDFLNTSARASVFTENSNSLQAYDEILKDICQAQEKCHEEIKNLQVLKEKYKQVSSKQFNEILKNYLQYKNRVENLVAFKK